MIRSSGMKGPGSVLAPVLKAWLNIWRGRLMHDMYLHVHRFFDKLAPVVKAWLDSLP